MSKNPFWNLFVTILKGPNYMTRKIMHIEGEKIKNRETLRHLTNIKSFVEAVAGTTQSESLRMWSKDTLKSTNELIKDFSNYDRRKT